MNKTSKMLAVFILALATQQSFAQSNKEQAIAKGKEAIRLEDEEGKFDEAISLFSEAQKLDPDDINYPYEMAYAYTGKKEYKKASDLLETIVNRKDANGRVYQSLGNAYDNQGMSEKAIETYEKGLKKFPNSGELYLELGNMQIVKEEYNKALNYYEKGIEKDPKFPSNYYWAAKIYCASTEEVWGMIYGEIFMNMERNSKRTAEMSKLLFDTYKRGITFTSDTSFGVSFSKTSSMSVDDLKDPKKFKLPFGTGCYEMVLMFSVLGEKKVDINSLDRIRSRFVDQYFQKDNATKYPNILFDYQRQIKKAGHLEAYNHWLLMKGDEQGFEDWAKANKTKWEAFVSWFTNNKLQVDLTHRFYRGQY